MFATIVLRMYGMHIFPSASVIAQTVLIYIICVSLYLRVHHLAVHTREY